MTDRARTLVAALGLALLAVVGLASCAPPGPRDLGLLAGRAPISARGVGSAERMTDGLVVPEGDSWRSPSTSIFDSARASVTWDLGAPTHVACALLQGDDNDRYLVEGSEDGATFAPIWAAEPTVAHGVATRSSCELDASARFVRLSASGGDGAYAVSELVLYAARPARFPPALDVVRPKHPEEDAHRRALVFAIVGVLVALFAPARRRLFVAAWMLPLGAAVWVGAAMGDLWPPIEREETVLRAALAVVAAAVVLRSVKGAPEKRPSPRATNGVLGVLAIAALACFFHLGHGQFGYHARGRQTFVHPWDMRVYFPVAKYFDELRFDGLYLASVAAYLDETGKSPVDVGGVELRDLHDNQMRRVREVVPEISAVRRRFSPERWASFRRDMRFFLDLMGDGGYLGSLRDHGGNATPTWLFAASLLFSHATASETTLALAGLLDPLLLVAMLVVVARTFGVRAMLVLAIVFGTSDFQRFGTNLVGSTLRYDWMALLGFAACALKTRRFMLGGALLGWAALIRAFPAFAVAGIVGPFAAWLVGEAVRRRALPAWSELVAEARPALRASLGVAIACAVLVAAPAAKWGMSGSWGVWAQKIGAHADKPNVNHVGLRTALSFEPEHVGERVLRRELPEPWTDWQKYQLAAFARRKPAFFVIALGFVAAFVAACRGRRLDQAALGGMLLVPILLYPANYYCHFVFLVPLLAVDDDDDSGSRFVHVAVAVLLLGVAQLVALQDPRGDVCFAKQSFALLAAIAVILVPRAVAFARRRSPAAPRADVAPPLAGA